MAEYNNIIVEWSAFLGRERRRGPGEECGGAHIYELVEAATDPGNARAADAAAELAEIFGGDINIEALVGTDYSPDEINGALDLDWGVARCPAASVRPRPLHLSVLQPPIADLLDAVRTSPDRRMLRRLIDGADLAAPVLVEAAVAAAMVRPLRRPSSPTIQPPWRARYW